MILQVNHVLPAECVGSGFTCNTIMNIIIHLLIQAQEKTNSVKKQKTNVCTKITPLTDHDHTYYNGAISDMNIFNIPVLVR